jgi:hypothetical protein
VFIINFGCSSTGEGIFRSMEVHGFLNLISYFEDDPLPNPSPSTLLDFSISGKSRNSLISSFTSASMEYVF